VRIDIGCIPSIESEVIVLGEHAIAFKATVSSAFYIIAISPGIIYPNRHCRMGDCGIGVNEVVRRDSYVPLR